MTIDIFGGSLPGGIWEAARRNSTLAVTQAQPAGTHSARSDADEERSDPEWILMNDFRMLPLAIGRPGG